MPRIEEMYAFISEDSGPDDEGVISFMSQTQWFPMVGADMTRVTQLRPIAQAIARATGKRVKLVKFTQREEIDEL